MCQARQPLLGITQPNIREEMHQIGCAYIVHIKREVENQQRKNADKYKYIERYIDTYRYI